MAGTSYLRGITCSDMRRVVRAALQAGWQWDGFTGTTHARLLWPATGEHVVFGTTPSVASWKSLATDIKRVSGVEVWHKGNRKRSRKKVKTSGYSTEAAAREQRQWHQSHDEDVAALLERRTWLIGKAQHLAANRGTLRDIPAVLDDIAHVEARLAAMAQPVEPFDPMTLATA